MLQHTQSFTFSAIGNIALLKKIISVYLAFYSRVSGKGNFARKQNRRGLWFVGRRAFGIFMSVDNVNLSIPRFKQINVMNRMYNNIKKNKVP